VGRRARRPSLILASASPQRRVILEQIGVPFEVRVPNVEELTEGPVAEVVLENAYRKAAAVAATAVGGEPPVLGVDTVVSLGAGAGSIFGKPRDKAHAAEMLTALAGRRHIVYSGVCLIETDPDRPRTRTAATETVVEFRALDPAMIDSYVATGEWRGRAGAYAIQGVGATLVSRIEGDYLSVVGLPVATLLDLMPGLIGG
jgi:septum formation protein